MLIVFCKLKDMTRAIASAKEAAEASASYIPGTLRALSQSRFATRHRHPQDTDRTVEIHHLFFDLSI